MDDKEIRRVLMTQLAVSRAIAGRALAAGRRRTERAIEAGKIPVKPAGTVPTSWLRQVLQLDDNGGPQAA
jgi:hypothetical protein